jgi:ABC-type dipeptide/oligopeptide/nickel transport system ATPase component
VPSTATAATIAAITEIANGRAQADQRGPDLGALPVEERADAQRREQGPQIGTKVALKNGGPTETLLPVVQVEEQRIERAQQHRRRERAEQQVVQDQRALAAHRLEQPAAAELRRRQA